jgi:hypothetical protein
MVTQALTILHGQSPTDREGENSDKSGKDKGFRTAITLGASDPIIIPMTVSAIASIASIMVGSGKTVVETLQKKYNLLVSNTTTFPREY